MSVARPHPPDSNRDEILFEAVKLGGIVVRHVWSRECPSKCGRWLEKGHLSEVIWCECGERWG